MRLAGWSVGRDDAGRGGPTGGGGWQRSRRKRPRRVGASRQRGVLVGGTGATESGRRVGPRERVPIRCRLVGYLAGGRQPGPRYSTYITVPITDTITDTTVCNM